MRILAGSWRDDQRISWSIAGRIEGDPARSTRGALEPTIAQLQGGRILAVMRGSNDVKPHLPGYRWYAISSPNRASWSPARPWTYTDGGAFFSPSSCSQLLRHSSGPLLWIGNLCAENPHGNSPRYPLVIAEVDRESGLVVRDSVTTLDDRAPHENVRLTLSNFHAIEDRQTGEVLVTLPRYFAQAPMHGSAGFTADLTLLRCGVSR